LTELLVGDLACGSGHILNECFDILYDLYIYEGYSRREAIENIFTKNLRGVDLDARAKQLAMFALMLKACQKDASFADAHVLPHVLSMPTPIPQEEVPSRLQQFFRETPSRQQLSDLTEAFVLMQGCRIPWFYHEVRCEQTPHYWLSVRHWIIGIASSSYQKKLKRSFLQWN
jgi:hypothetical protein